MDIFVKKGGDIIEPINGKRRLEVKLELFGEAQVKLVESGREIIVIRDQKGNLVEKEITTH